MSGCEHDRAAFEHGPPFVLGDIGVCLLCGTRLEVTGDLNDLTFKPDEPDGFTYTHHRGRP